MAIIKCKMCGGDLILEEGSNVAECEYCGTRQTVPTADNEKKMNLFARANRLRANNEFDKAAGVYESIVADFPEEAEAYWGLILCKYGIEYVDDPGTGKKVPTCHRSSFDSLMDDPNFELVMEYADPIARRVYREEAKQIEELRKGIIEVSSKEEPYDIFICYKETADDGQRTLDSVLAQDVYDMLTENGYRVFFSRVSLEDKLGVEYEPYIFAALNSAKIMLAFGTDYDYYNAVWVKNEWSRFLQLLAKGEKKTLIPCYKNIDAYDMPKEFAKLQAQDLGKVGAMQDLLRGIKKILPKAAPDAGANPAAGIPSSSTSAYTERAMFMLEDGDFTKADEYFEKALDQNPKESKAYLGKTMVALGVRNEAALRKTPVILTEFREFCRAQQFADAALQKKLADIAGDCGRLFWAVKLHSELQKAINKKRQDALRQEQEREEKRKIDALLLHTGIYQAIQNDDDEAAMEYLCKDIDPNYSYDDHDGNVPLLICAIRQGNIGMVEQLLAKGANPDCERIYKNDSRFSALRDSIIEWPNDEIAQILIDAGADVNYVAVNQKVKVPLLSSAIFKQNVHMVKLLLANGADPNCERTFIDGRRTSALRDSIIELPNDEIAQILISAGADVNYKETNSNAKAPLLNSAICEQNAPMVKLLLANGADPNCERTFNDGRRFSALRDSIIEWPNDEIAQILIDAGADVNYCATNSKVKVPVLSSAIANGNAGMVKTLLEKGADPNCERVFHDGQRYSALRDSIMEWPNDEIARLLIEAGADVKYVEVLHTKSGLKGNVPVLIDAICKKNAGIVKLLLEKGADPNCQRVFDNGKRFSALQGSVLEWPNEKISLMLLDAGASFEMDEQLRKSKIEKLHFSKEALARFRKAGWKPPLF